MAAPRIFDFIAQAGIGCACCVQRNRLMMLIALPVYAIFMFRCRFPWVVPSYTWRRQVWLLRAEKITSRCATIYFQTGVT